MEFEKFIILLFSFVFLLFSEFSISGEELPENHRVQEEIKKMFAAGDKNKERGASPNIHSNVVIVTGEKGAASGVKTLFGELPVIISNAHVIFEIENPKIQDMQGRTYVIERIYASKTRDLVFLKYRYENGNDQDLLEIIPHFDRYERGIPVTAYGNTLGHGVIAETKGSLIASGPIFVEMTNGIVGGNSGGPLIEDRSGKIIGISTLSRMVIPSIWNLNTPYESTYQSLKIRNFAVRVDNLNADDIEVLSAKEYQEDQRMYGRMENYLMKIEMLLKDKSLNASVLLRKVKHESIRFSPAFLKLNQYSWKSTYLKKDYEKKRRIVNRLFQQLDMKDELLSASVSEIWQKVPIRTRRVTSSAKTVSCRNCRGTGLVAKQNVSSRNEGFQENRDARSRMRMEINYIGQKCPVCNGTRKLVLSEGVSCDQYLIPEEILSDLRSKIKQESHPFYGFVVGGNMMDEYERFAYYQEKKHLLFRIPNPFGPTLAFSGNHRIPNAEATILTFMLGKLVRVQIALPASKSTWKSMEAFMEEHFSEIQTYHVTMNVSDNLIWINCIHEIYPILNQIKDHGESGNGGKSEKSESGERNESNSSHGFHGSIGF